MFRRIEDFVACWNENASETRRVLAALTDEALGQAVGEGHRTLARMAWHLVRTIVGMAAEVDLVVEGPTSDAPVPDSAEAIRSAYERAARSMVDAVTARWTDATLDFEDEMYGETWKRG